MNLRAVVATMMMTGFGTGPVLAQDTSVPIRLADAVESALNANPAMQVAAARVDAAEGRTTEARSTLLPQLKLSGRAAYLSEIPEFTISLPLIGTQTLFPSIVRNYGVKLTLQQTLFSGFRDWKSVEMAEHNETAAGFEYRKDRSDLVLTVKTAYWNLYRAYRIEHVLAQTVEQMSVHLEDVRNFHKQGMATDLEVLRVQTQLSDVQVRHIEAQGAFRLAQMSLNSLTGRPLQREITPVDTPDVESEPMELARDIERLMETARAQRPEVAAARERRSLQEAAVGVARSGWYPQVLLAANYDYARPNPRIIPPNEVWDKSWDVGLLLQWNLWDWFATDSRASQARATLAQSEAFLSQVNDAVALEAAQSFFRVKEARERIAVATLGTLQAEEGYRTTREKFQRGLASNTDMLDVETALLQARLNETQARVDYVIQAERLRKAIGSGQ